MHYQDSIRIKGESMKKKFKRIVSLVVICAFLMPSSAFGLVNYYKNYYVWDGKAYFGYSQDASKISVIYTGDMLGNFSSDKSGDMARTMNMIKEARRYYPDSYLVDAGNFTGDGNAFGSSLGTSFELKAMEVMAYDCVQLGNKELASGLKNLSDNLAQAISDPVNGKGIFAYPKLILSNLDWDNTGNAQLKSQFGKFTEDLSFAVVQKNRSMVGFVGATEPSKKLKKKGVNLLDSATAINDGVKALKKANKNLDAVVCLYCGDDGEELAKSLEGVDLLVINPLKVNKHSQDQIIEENSPEKIGDVNVVRTMGTSAVGQIVLNKKGKKVDVDKVFSYKVDESIPQNPAIIKVQKDYEEAIDKSYFGLYGYSSKSYLGYNNVSFGHFKKFAQKQGPDSFGDLISDSYVYIGKKYGEGEKAIAGSFFAAGTVKDNFSRGKITVMDAYNVFDQKQGDDGLPGSNLVDVYLSGAELKILAEIDASVSEKNHDVRLYTSGITYEYNPHRFYRNKVSKVLINDNEEVKQRGLYRVITDTRTIQLINQAKKAPLGLMDIEFKDKDGNPIEKLDKAVIKYKGNPVKQWFALAKFVDKKGISSHYRHADNRKILNDDKSLKAIFENPGKIFLVSLFAGIIAIALLIIVLVAILSGIRRALGIRNSSFYRKARKANKQKSIFKHRKNRYKRNMKYRRESKFSKWMSKFRR